MAVPGLVPWRLVLPTEHLDFICGADGAEIMRVASISGARVDGPTELPRLGPVVTIHGTMWQKRTLGKLLVERLWEARGGDPQRLAAFSSSMAIVLPEVTRSAVSEEKVRRSVDDIGAGMKIDPPLDGSGAIRYGVMFEGTATQVISGITRVNTVVQDLADCRQVKPQDFQESDSCAPPPSAEELVRAARLCPAAGVGTAKPHPESRELLELQARGCEYVPVKPSADVLVAHNVGLRDGLGAPATASTLHEGSSPSASTPLQVAPVPVQSAVPLSTSTPAPPMVSNTCPARDDHHIRRGCTCSEDYWWAWPSDVRWCSKAAWIAKCLYLGIVAPGACCR